MTDELLIELSDEVRKDFQIPPYFDNATINRALRESEARLIQLNPAADFETDAVGRSLLKNYAYYHIYHKPEEFEKNYEQLVLSWQLSAASEEAS
jgi:hypothetical protein